MKLSDFEKVTKLRDRLATARTFHKSIDGSGVITVVGNSYPGFKQELSAYDPPSVLGEVYAMVKACMLGLAQKQINDAEDALKALGVEPDEVAP